MFSLSSKPVKYKNRLDKIIFGHTTVKSNYSSVQTDRFRLEINALKSFLTWFYFREQFSTVGFFLFVAIGTNFQIIFPQKHFTGWRIWIHATLISTCKLSHTAGAYPYNIFSQSIDRRDDIKRKCISRESAK